MPFDPISAALDVGSKIIDRLWPDPKTKANLKLITSQQYGKFSKKIHQKRLRYYNISKQE